MNQPPVQSGDSSRLWTSPVGLLSVGVEPADVGNSLASVSTHLIDYGVPAIPVVHEERYVGLVTEADLVGALSAGAESTGAVEGVIRRDAPAVSGKMPATEVLRLFESTGLPALAVVDSDNRVVGVITPSRLLAPTDREARPKLVGGMATPFGVYLTGGGVSGGVAPYALIAAGAFLFALFVAGAYLALLVGWLLPREFMRAAWFEPLISALGLLFFFLLMRLAPLTGYHAAEHMVVHAIEQSEPLERETVARMPRVHPRCGTNVAVGLAIFLGLSGLAWTPEAELRTVVALLATMLFFRPLGSFIQSTFTTRPPNAAQLDAGIRAGKELLDRYQTEARSNISPLRRLWQSGLFYVMMGSMGAGLLAYLITEVLRLPPYWRVV